MTDSPPPKEGEPSRRAPGRARATSHSGGWQRLAIKVAIAMGALSLLGFLFWRSVRGASATPYTISVGSMQGWNLAFDPNAAGPNDPVLMLQPPPELSRDLFGQLFKRIMESMNAPSTPAVPLLLRREFAGEVPPATLLAAARAAGLDGPAFRPRCLGHRRISEPTGTQQIYFVLFDAPAYESFRRNIAALVGGSAYDPAALSPVLFIAASESTFARWLPLRANPDTDCMAPITVGPPL